MLIRQILSAIDILNFYLDLRYDIRKNTNTKKDRKWRINGNSNYKTKRSSGNGWCWRDHFKDIRRQSLQTASDTKENLDDRARISAAFPKTEQQRCIVHMVRNILKYVANKDMKAFAKDLKTIYTAANEESARKQLEAVTRKWSGQYPSAMNRWIHAIEDWISREAYFRVHRHWWKPYT